MNDELFYQHFVQLQTQLTELTKLAAIMNEKLKTLPQETAHAVLNTPVTDTWPLWDGRK